MGNPGAAGAKGDTGDTGPAGPASGRGITELTLTTAALTPGTGEWSTYIDLTSNSYTVPTTVPAGGVDVDVDVVPTASRAPRGGGDRHILEFQLLRTRGAATASLATEEFYPRFINIAGDIGDTPDEYNWAYHGHYSVAPSDLAAGDTLKVQVRAMWQENGTTPNTFPATNNLPCNNHALVIAYDGQQAGGGSYTDAQANARIQAYTGQTSTSDTFARNRLPLATRTQPGAVSAADQANIERLSRIPTPTTADSGEVLGVNAAGDYALQDATPAYTLPMRLRDFNLDLTGDGYVLQANAVARSRSNTAYTLTLAAPLVYANSYMPSPRVANSHYAFRLPADTAIDMAEVRIGEADGVTGLFTRMDLSDATALGTQGGFDYYSLQIDDVPVGDSLTVVILDPVEIDFSKVEALQPGLPNVLTNRPTIPSPTAGGGTTGLQIHTGAGVGVSVTDSSSTARIRLQLFSPVPLTWIRPAIREVPS